MLSFIYRYVNYKGGETLQRHNLNGYHDRYSISDYAVPAVKWATAVRLVKGRTETTIVPKDTLTRSELAQILMNLTTRILENESVMHPSSVEVPVLIYHSIDDTVQNASTISSADFEAVIAMLSEAGYHAVSYDQLVDFVDNGTSLPENPVVITFDDGYQNNLDYGYDILKQYGFCAEISVICSFIGVVDHYDDFSVIPHFNLEDVLELEDGVINIQSHTDRMHMPYDYSDLDLGRRGVAKRVTETEEEYIARLRTDFQASFDRIASVLDAPKALTYPFGIFSSQAEAVAKEVGYRVTVTTRNGKNVITQGDPDCLYLLNRVEVTADMTAEAFAAMMNSFS